MRYAVTVAHPELAAPGVRRYLTHSDTVRFAPGERRAYDVTVPLNSAQGAQCPIAETDRALSVFGHLDATADTQWIRVLPLRPLLPTSPDPLGLRVELEQLGAGGRSCCAIRSSSTGGIRS